MSKKAKEAALKAYPPMEKESHEIYLLRDGFINGYEQAEKDLTLTWEDIREIDDLIGVCFTDCEEGDTLKEIYEEVLRRFLENKKEG